MGELDELLAAYLASYEPLREAYAGMTREEATARPGPGKWSSLEVLCHLVDLDLMSAWRIRAAVGTDRPRQIALTQEQLTGQMTPEARDVAEELALFWSLRMQTARIVRAAGPGVLDRQILLVKPGGEEVARTVRELLVNVTRHITHHLKFVHAKRKALGLAGARA